MSSPLDVELVRTDDGVELSYKMLGDGPQDIVFVHGWGSTKTYFDQALEEMDLTGCRAIVVDLRGHGESEVPDGGYTIERFAADVLAIADQAGADRFVTVGHSLGGKIALYLPVMNMNRVQGQVLVAPAVASEVPLPEETHREFVGYAGDKEAFLRSHHAITHQPVPHEVSEHWAEEGSKLPSFVLDETLKMSFGMPFDKDLARVDTLPPTLVVAGSEDPFFSPEFLRESLVAHVPGSRLLLRECGHEIPLELPRELAGMTEAFIAGCVDQESRRR